MLCKCGCGQETTLAKRTDERYGTTEGEPLEYAVGHHNSTRKLTKEEALARRRESRKNWASRNPGAFRETRLKTMGWSEEKIRQTKEDQEERCAICGEKKELVPDHKHVKPAVPRGLLCHACNVGLGMFKENPDMLEAAATYVRHYDRAELYRTVVP